MLFALNKHNEKILSKPKIKGSCPICKEELIPKCGSIKIWHWSHKNIKDCDNWSDGETIWHLKWKSIINKKYCEVKIGNHRADIHYNTKTIELQNSPINYREINNRENFYNNMIWIINANDFSHNFIIKENDNYVSFRWLWPRKSLWYIKNPLYLDFGNYILHIKKIYLNTPCGGWGYKINKLKFIENNIHPLILKSDWHERI